MIPERRLTYFISDMHLGAGYMPNARVHEAAVCAFLRHIAPSARRLVMVGDVLDYWFEYREVVPRGHIRFFGALAALADAGVEIIWYAGNHDIWLSDYLQSEIGLETRDPHNGYELCHWDGTLFCIGHGDGIGHRTPGFRLIRSIFRNRLCQRLFAAIHPRWTVPFAHRWSSHSRKGYAAPECLPAKTRTDIELFARRQLKAYPRLRFVVLGHHHVPVDEPVTPDCRLIVLGDWLTRHTYAVFDGSDIELREFCQNRKIDITHAKA